MHVPYAPLLIMEVISCRELQVLIDYVIMQIAHQLIQVAA